MEGLEIINNLLLENGEITTNELQDKLSEFGFHACRCTVSHLLHRSTRAEGDKCHTSRVRKVGCGELLFLDESEK